MITKDQFLGSLDHEFMTIRHLASKITDEQLSYRPTPGQRNLLELLQYMSFLFSTTAEVLINGDMSIYQSRSEAAALLTYADFDAAMEAQMKHIRTVIEPLSEEQLAEEVNMWVTQSRAMHFLNGLLKWAAAYKMQLFLYLKASGSTELSTMNLWAGVDAQPRADAQA